MSQNEDVTLEVKVLKDTRVHITFHTATLGPHTAAHCITFFN